MKKSCIRLCAFVCVWGAVLALSPSMTAEDAQLVVDDDRVQCPTAGFTTIQAAVNAARPGQQIRVCPGTYNEQVLITRPLKIMADPGAIVMPSRVVQNTTSLSTGNPIAAIILVAGTPNVDIKGLTVDAANHNIRACSPSLMGIFYRNASGQVQKVTVRNVKLGPGLEGCQSGNAIFVQSGQGGTSYVEVEDSSVHDYQKNGITGNELGTHVAIKTNVVTGLGPTTGAAQNGIQIGFGARGTIRGNTVANHIWSPCVSVNVCAWNATDILVFDAADVMIKHNVVGISQTGIYLEGNHSEAEGNRIFGTAVFDGIFVLGDANALEENTITHSDESGIFLQGNNNQVHANTINEAPVGVWKASGFVGNIISGNHFFNTPTRILDPLPRGRLPVSPAP